MRHIEKTAEPPSLTQWKHQGDENWNPGWGDFDTRPIEQIVKQLLLQEQGFLCCYCEIRVDQNRGHIEHIQPRHSHPELALEYGDMLYCCPETPRGRPTTCGHARKPNDPVPVSPLDADCESRFRYAETGEMLARDENDQAAKSTIRILNLNEATLRRSRAEVYQEVADARREVSAEEFRRWLDLELQRDSEGRLNPFWATKRYVSETVE